MRSSILLIGLGFQFFNLLAQQSLNDKVIIYIDRETGQKYGKYDIQGVVGWHNNAFKYVVKITDDTIFYYLDDRKFSDVEITHDSISQLIVNKTIQVDSIIDLEGNLYTQSDFESKVIVYNFWATSCAPCIAEIPELNRLAESYSNKDVIFFAPLNDSDQSKIKNFLSKKDFKYNVVPDAHLLVQIFNAFGLPTHIIVDKKGIVRFSQFGGNSATIFDLLNDEIKKYL